jgi:hypothetical protein
MMRTTESQNAAGHLRSWAPTLFVAVLLFGFAFIAQEVTEGEPIAFDRWLMVAFRHASDLSRPIGPPWLLDVVRDITALGSTAVLALLVTIVTTFLFTVAMVSVAIVPAKRVRLFICPRVITTSPTNRPPLLLTTSCSTGRPCSA